MCQLTIITAVAGHAVATVTLVLVYAYGFSASLGEVIEWNSRMAALTLPQ